MKEEYKSWIKLREDTADEEGKLCYCGHTFKCECNDPDFNTFLDSVNRGTIIPKDRKNGWKNVNW